LLRVIEELAVALTREGALGLQPVGLGADGAQAGLVRSCRGGRHGFASHVPAKLDEALSPNVTEHAWPIVHATFVE
jgi:hypothetical protein